MQRISLWCLSLYGLYLIKSAMGINILQNYSAWWVLKLPIQPIMEARYGSNWH
jgi:hypothetical protein